MRADELVVLTKAEHEELKARAEGRSGDGELFNSEEMQAIRDQYEERILVEQEKREELEWKLRLELAKIRDAELSARRAADEMRRIELTLQALLTSDEDVTEVRSTVPSPRLQPVAPRPQAVVSLRQGPPPVPVSTNGHGRANGNGQSHADKFRAAMAHRKSYDA